MRRALWVTCGLVLAVPLVLAVRHDPHLWAALLQHASRHARHLGDALDGWLADRTGR
jgi:hypothetical protein